MIGPEPATVIMVEVITNPQMPQTIRVLSIMANKFAGINSFKIGLAGVGLLGAMFYVTFDPITVLSYGLYILMASLTAPLIWDLIN